MPIDYKKYTFQELKDISRSIDRVNHPDNYSALMKEIKRREKKGERLEGDDRDVDNSARYKSMYCRKDDTSSAGISDRLTMGAFYGCALAIVVLFVTRMIPGINIDNIYFIYACAGLGLAGVFLHRLRIYLKRRCPSCGSRMERFRPLKPHSTYIYVCHKCKCYIDTGIEKDGSRPDEFMKTHGE